MRSLLCGKCTAGKKIRKPRVQTAGRYTILTNGIGSFKSGTLPLSSSPAGAWTTERSLPRKAKSCRRSTSRTRQPATSPSLTANLKHNSGIFWTGGTIQKNILPRSSNRPNRQKHHRNSRNQSNPKNASQNGRNRPRKRFHLHPRQTRSVRK